MTRLTDEWMAQLNCGLDAYQTRLHAQTGLDFLGVAALCAGVDRAHMQRAADSCTVAAVPVSAGEGEIGGFCAAVAGIVRAAGFSAFTTLAADVNGVYEAHMRGADIVFMADDARYIALRTDKRCLADNDRATALGYTALLDKVCGGVRNKRVLVAGCGIIGRRAGEYLLARGAQPVYYDTDRARLNAMKKSYPVEIDASCFGRYELLVDATNTGGWLTGDMLKNISWVAAPGVPCSLTEAAMLTHGARVLHDKLHIGTLAMLGLCCRE